GLDQPSRTIEIQGFDGDLDEIDQEVWAGLPLGLAEAPEDWTGPVDVTGDELDGQGSEMSAADWVDQLQSRANMEVWEDTLDPEERDAQSCWQQRRSLDIWETSCTPCVSSSWCRSSSTPRGNSRVASS